MSITLQKKILNTFPVCTIWYHVVVSVVASSFTNQFSIFFLDIALKIVKKYPMLGRKSTLLGVLARKPEAFQEKESNIIERTIKLRDYLYNLMFTTHQPSERNQPEPSREIVRRDSVVIPLKAPSTKKSNIIIRTINLGKYIYLHIIF